MQEDEVVAVTNNRKKQEAVRSTNPVSLPNKEHKIEVAEPVVPVEKHVEEPK